MPALKWPRAALLAFLVIVSFTLGASLTPAHAQDVSPRKADKIREMIQLAQADKVIDAMLPIISEQMKNSIKQNAPNVRDTHVDIIVETMQEEMRASVDMFFELMVPQYDAMLSEQVIDDTIAFYKTPSGQELIKATPNLTAIGGRVGQQWAQMVAPRAAAKAKRKAQELGYNL